jgi:L-threonylcarbamoyladenylate synthase
VRGAAAALARGAILAHPTATVYGLGGLDPELDRAIARLKGRPPGKPLLRIAATPEALRAAHPELTWDERATRLAEAFWPGPLTLVLPGGGPDGLAVRVEAHPVTRAVLRSLGPVTMSSTSLNRSGSAPARTPAQVRRFLALVETAAPEVWFLDAGPLPPSPPSTVLSLVEEPARLLREGAVSFEEVERVLGEGVAG